jgi:hypothetical protein
MSTSSIETFTTLAVAGVALLYGYSVYNRASTSPPTTTELQNTQSASPDVSQNAPGKKNKKKKKGASAAPTPGTVTPVVSFPEAIPGSLSLEDVNANVSPKAQTQTQVIPETVVTADTAPSEKAKKQKKKKPAKKAAATASSAVDTDSAAPQEPSASTSTNTNAQSQRRQRRDSSPHDGQTDASWIYVGDAKKSARKGKGKGKEHQQTATGSNKSDQSESAVHELEVLGQEEKEEEKPKDNVRTLAEKILPKPRKTKVDE